jgi:hypothetical protein
MLVVVAIVYDGAEKTPFGVSVSSNLAVHDGFEQRRWRRAWGLFGIRARCE